MHYWAAFCSAIAILTSCNNDKPLPQVFNDTVSRIEHKSTHVDSVPNNGPICHKPGEYITSISGHFTAGRPTDTISVLLTKEDDTSTEDHDETYCLQMTTGNASTFDLDCCLPSLINEGDLDGDGLDEFSVFQEPNHGCTQNISTFTFKKGSFKRLFEPFLYSTGCNEFTDEQKQQLVRVADHVVYYGQADADDTGAIKLVWKKAVIAR